MSAPLFHQTLSPDQAKERVIKKRQLRRPERARMLQKLQEATIRLSHHGRIRIHARQKKDGGTRPICAIELKDHVAAHTVLPGWTAALKSIAHETDYGALPGQGRDQAVHSLTSRLVSKPQQRTTVVLADIKECYDTVPRKPLLDTPVGMAQRVQLKALLKAFDDVAKYPGKGVPQGSALSPVLCAIAITKKVITPMRKRFPTCLVQVYADDVCMVARNPVIAASMLQYLGVLLRKAGMSLSETKTETHVFSPGTTFGYLGLEIRWSDHGPLVGIPTRAFSNLWNHLLEGKHSKGEIHAAIQGWISAMSCVTCQEDRLLAQRFVSLCEDHWDLKQGIWTPISWGARGSCQ